MTIANRLIAVLNDAKANRLTVEIKEQENGQILTSIDDGYYKESFLSDDLEYLVYRLKMEVNDRRLM